MKNAFVDVLDASGRKPVEMLLAAGVVAYVWNPSTWKAKAGGSPRVMARLGYRERPE